MTDRELLEMAAKAAGYPQPANPCYGEDVGILVVVAKGNHVFFNSLRDDGDALRLAVKLGISIMFSTDEDNVPIVRAIHFGTPESKWTRMRMSPDFRAATRRAITLAAAAIGEGMK